MSDGARLNLVRCDTLADAEDLDQHSLSDAYDRYDEVELVTPRGEPAAMPSAPVWIDQDIRYEYVNGGIGSSARRARHQIALAVDYLDSLTRSKLERWQRERALVWFNPGFGRFTDFAYRPVSGAGANFADGSTSLTDLTGRWSMATAGDSTNTMVWDADMQVMRGPFDGTSPRRVIPSPFGAVQVCERTKTNRHRPGYPVNAVEGHGTSDCGWMKTGTESADITLSIESSGDFVFGHSDCRDALRVQTTYASGRTRLITASNQWNSAHAEHHYTFTGSGTATLSIWLKGRFSENATLTFQQLGGNSDSVTLGGLNLAEWTRFSLSVYSADWSTGLPYLAISLSAATTADSADFFIGPMMVCQDSGTTSQHSPEWAPYGTSVTNSYQSVSSFRFPAAGSALVSFYVPEGVDRYIHFPLGTDAAVGRLGLYGESAARWWRTATEYLGGTVTVNEGEINTLAAVWGSGGDSRLYFNGELVDEAGASEREVDVADSAVALYVGQSNGYAAWPLGLMSARIDSRVYTSDEIAQLDAALRDPVANLLSVQARGRKYRIVQIPSTPRNQVGGTQWVGNLVLEEYEYDSNLSDVVTLEVY